MLGSLLAFARYAPRTGASSLTSKKAPIGFYKGKGAKSTGRHTRKGGYVLEPHKLPRYVVPDLRGFEVGSGGGGRTTGCFPAGNPISWLSPPPSFLPRSSSVVLSFLCVAFSRHNPKLKAYVAHATPKPRKSLLGPVAASAAAAPKA